MAAAALFFVAALLLAPLVLADTLVVPSRDYLTLSSATLAASSGDTIKIKSDLLGCGPTADGAVVRDKNVSIVGVGNPTVDCLNKGGRAITAAGSDLAGLPPISITITGIHFVGGSALPGAISISEKIATVVIQNCSFSNNIGGAVRITDGGDFEPIEIEVSHCSFFSNSEGGAGGGLYIYSSSLTDSVINLSNNNFVNNSAGYGGGGLALLLLGSVDNSLLNINSSTFVNNSAMGPGGGILLSLMFISKSTFNIGNDESSFVENSITDSGGAIAVKFVGTATNSALNIGNGGSQFLKNQAQKGAGGIQLQMGGASGMTLNIADEKALFTGNVALGTAHTNDTGAVQVWIGGTVFNSSLAVANGKSSFVDNSGAAILLCLDETREINSTVRLGKDGSTFIPRGPSMAKTACNIP